MRPRPYSGLGPAQVARRVVAPLLFLGALLWTVVRRPAPDPAAPELAEFSGEAIGTTFTVKVAGPPLSPDAEAAVGAAIQAELDGVNRGMSSWLPDSELSRLSAAPDPGPHPVSAELFEVLALAQGVSEASDGAFDVTVLPLVKAWGFQQDGAPPPPPDPAALDALRARVGFRKLRVDPASRSVEKLDPAVSIDLSAIAKGWVVDQISLALAALGHADHMVEIGGEVRTSGHNGLGEPWRIAVERPDVEGRAVARVVPLSGLSMATSGDYRSYREVDGRRISHTIDPRTAAPITHRLASVSVVMPDCASADAWATALNVLGPDAGPQKAAELGIAAWFLVRDDAGGFVARTTPAFEALAGPAR
jgi:thiamine biosynthesis lipoprotein